MTREYIPMTGEAKSSLVAISVLWCLFAVVVFFRLLGRLRGIGIGPDDVLALAACILAASTIGMSAAVYISGVGYSLKTTTELIPKLTVNMPFIMQATFAFTLVYLWTLACLKLSQLCFYYRAFSVQLRWWLYAVGAIVVCWAIIFTFVFVFLCDPVSDQWSVVRDGHCMDQILVLKCIIMTNVVTDLFIVILPIWTVWQLQMRTTEKIAVLACFALGLACCIIGIVRFWQIFVVDLTGDLTGTSLMTFMLCTVELMLAGLCINIPMLRPFYLRWRAKYKGTSSSNTGAESSFKGSRSGQLNLNPPKQGKSMAWIELTDKNQDTGSNDDGSERKLTREQPEAAIHVSTDWRVTRD